MKGWLLGSLVAVGVVSAAREAAAKPRHSGFTGDLGIGAALTLVPHHSVSACSSTLPGGCVAPSSTSETRSEFGLAPLSLTLGGFVSPEVALAARFAGTSYFKDDDQIGHNFYGAILEYWPIERLYVSGGIGFALFGPNPLFSSSSRELEGGWALDFRIGAALAGGRDHDFTLSLEAIPGFYDDDIVTGFGLVGAWKWY
ncbi:MAG TPA: hypothetical protein VJN18_06880 [Polyangiaceae bacterium]|nr:hypothetical protein [Polyangiaceae bacterium]